MRVEQKSSEEEFTAVQTVEPFLLGRPFSLASRVFFLSVLSQPPCHASSSPSVIPLLPPAL